MIFWDLLRFSLQVISHQNHSNHRLIQWITSIILPRSAGYPVWSSHRRRTWLDNVQWSSKWGRYLMKILLIVLKALLDTEKTNWGDKLMRHTRSLLMIYWRILWTILLISNPEPINRFTAINKLVHGPPVRKRADHTQRSPLRENFFKFFLSHSPKIWYEKQKKANLIRKTAAIRLPAIVWTSSKQLITLQSSGWRWRQH